MKTHTSNFKEEIKLLGKQQDVRITYTINDEQIVLSSEDINSATPNYEASLLKSVMKGLDLDSNVDIPLGTQIKFEYGLLVNGVYEYLDYGNYIVYSSEKQEDTLSYSIKCYDKMLYSMKDYEHIDITYPTTIYNFLKKLCEKIGLTMKEANFANMTRTVPSDLFMTINEDGTYSSMGYTYRDVLDQIAETTGGCICLTLDDKVEVRYVNKTINYEQSEKSNIIQFKTEVEEPIILERLEGKSIQATRSGKNLLDNTATTKISNGITFTVNSDGTVLADGTNDTTANSSLIINRYDLSPGTYVLNGCPSGGAINTYRLAIQETGSYSVLGSIDIGNGSGEFTIDTTTNVQISIFIQKGLTVNNLLFKPMLREATIADDTYEQYGASPSPDYPSEIENIEGNIEVKVEGKNKFDINQEKEIFGTMLYKYSYYLKPNTKYTISSNCPASTTANIYANSTSSNSAVYINKNQTIQSDENGYFYILVRFKADASDNSTFNLYEKILNGTYYIQLEEGSTATDYEPYKSQVVTFPLGEEKLMEGSYLDDDGIHHTRGQYEFTGNETGWGYNSAQNAFWIRNREITNCKNEAHAKLCNYFPYTSENFNVAPANTLCENSNSTIPMFIFKVSTDIANSLKTWKTWLQNHNLIVEYDLAEPEIVPYTAEQKTILTSIKTIKGTNKFEFPSDTIISYPINYDTIDEEYINDTNVNFGEKYGAINSIVLARAGESDKIYKKDQNSIELNGLCELMIKENQFMNFNDRSDYLQELSDKLFGVEYYLNDFTSTGIMYYDLLDVYNVKIGDKTYNCLMLNDEQDITQGLEENIYTERPEKSETDYTKADKTDRKINQTNLIVDKQNQKIEGVISQIGDRSEKTTTITADIDGLNSKVTNIADLTNTVSGIKTITLENCVEGRLLELNILGNNTVFTQGDSRITVTNYKNNSEESNSTRTYELGIVEVLRQKNNVYDEYILKEGKAQVIRRINKDGTIKDNEEIEHLGEYLIYLQEGTNIIEIQNYSAQIRAKFAIKSDYTDVFATKVEMNSEIKQTADSINLEVSKKVNETELGTKIVQDYESVQVAWNKITEFIQMMILNGNASLAILDNSKKILMSLDKTGQHFYDSSENKIGDVGVINYKNTPMIAFNLNVSQNNNKRNGLGNRKKWNILSDFLYCRNIL